MSKTRLNWIDANKGFAIILVVAYHAALGLESAGLMGRTSLLEYFWIYATSLATPIFFLMSGFFVERSVDKAGYQNYFKTSLQYILYPYFLWSIIQIVVKIIFSSFVNKQESFDFLEQFYAPPAQFWFLYALFLAQILFLMMHKFYNRHYILVAILFLVLSFVFYFMPTFADVLRSFAFLLIGAYFARDRVFERIADVKILGALLLCLALSGPLYFYILAPAIGFDARSNFIGGISATLMLGGIFIKYGSPVILQILGKYSMSIFVMHIIFLVPFRIILPKLGLDIPILILSICTLAGIVLPIVAAVIAERLKINDFLGIKAVGYF